MHKSLADQVLPQAVRDGLERLIGRHNMRRATRKGLCSERTQQHRRDIILLSFAQLWQDGFRLETAKALKEKHVEHLIERWDAEGLSPSMLHTRLSVLRTLSKWIHKQQVCKDLADYLPAERIKRSTVARTNLAWEGNGVELAAVLQTAYALNERFGLMLELQHQFGLRAKEVIQFRPAECYDNTLSALVVFEGTKGGRPRMIAVQTPAQKALIKRVVEMVGATTTARLRWPDTTWRQAHRRYYHYMHRLGATRAAMGVTGHGLRHGFAQAMYRRQTGLPTPIEGGDPKALSRADHVTAGMTISREMGHGRIDVVASYYGSYGHAQRKVEMPSRMEVVFKR